jgi:hypothetical protein
LCFVESINEALWFNTDDTDIMEAIAPVIYSFLAAVTALWSKCLDTNTIALLRAVIVTARSPFDEKHVRQVNVIVWLCHCHNFVRSLLNHTHTKQEQTFGRPVYEDDEKEEGVDNIEPTAFLNRSPNCPCLGDDPEGTRMRAYA